MHEPEKWGFIQFTTQKNLETIPFVNETNFKNKMAMYALFRAFKYGRLKT